MRRPEFIARQSRCPSGLLGRVIGHIMSVETAAANEAALKLLDLKAGDRVLEVGKRHGQRQRLRDLLQAFDPGPGCARAEKLSLRKRGGRIGWVQGQIA